MKEESKFRQHVGATTNPESKKQQGTMLTEHVNTLREVENYMPQPRLDEYDMQLINNEMDVAMKRQRHILIHTWRDGQVTRHQGKIVDINITNRVLTYEDPFKSRTLLIDEIVSVNSDDKK
ncbi:YolD-like family protein [Planococcus rifietoensis]|uniref:YolD-like family protein n=1 Tax=Planococcus rifietoensis TaxID=200991 RepID=UPI00384E6F01